MVTNRSVIMIIPNIIKKSDSNVSNDLYEENLRLRSDLELFTYIFSHDLVKPLRVLSNNTSQLAEISKNNNNKILRELVQEISESSNEMHQIINIILDYVRIEVSKVAFSSINLNEIIGAIAVQHKEEAIIKYENIPNIIGNKNYLNIVFNNLISNSIKYKNLDRQAEINIYCKEYEDMVEIIVQDNGIGIEEEYYEIIFLLFQRLHTKDEYPGYGAGLAIVKKIIELHGGKVWIESNFEKNTNIYFTLKKVFKEGKT